LTAVLDAWAVVALLKEEPSGARVERQVTDGETVVSSINLGEAYYVLAGGRTPAQERRVRAAIGALATRVRVDDPDWALVLSAAQLKARRRISYTDALCVATARRHRAAVWTGDPEIVALDDVVELVDLRGAP
jgi:PIN domain nuclease of toxin-antitoxin system